MQIARSEPAGPVYLIAAREVMEEAAARRYAVDRAAFGRSRRWRSPDEVTAEIAAALAGAQRPLVVTSYLGRRPGRGAERSSSCASCWPSGVLESMAYHVNFPADHALHHGFQYHTVAQNPVAGRGRRDPGHRQRRAVDPDR